MQPNQNTALKRILFILIGSLAVLSSCKKEVSKNVDQDKIYTYYELFYNQNEDVTTAKAVFTFSNATGTKLMLSDPSTVMVDGTEMEWDSDNAYYSVDFSGFKPMAEFVWVDTDGNTFTNEVNIQDIEFPTTVADLHYGDSIVYFMWEGVALDSFESVMLTVASETKRRVFSIDTLGATSIGIDSVTLAPVDSGQVMLELVKSYAPPLTEETSRGGEGVGKYRPVDRQVLLTD